MNLSGYSTAISLIPPAERLESQKAPRYIAGEHGGFPGMRRQHELQALSQHGPLTSPGYHFVFVIWYFFFS